MGRVLCGAGMVLLLSLSMAPAAAAQPVEEDSQDLEWRWERFRTWQYVATPAMILTAGGLYFLGPTPARHLDRPVLFDAPIQDALRLEDRETRSVVQGLS